MSFRRFMQIFAFAAALAISMSAPIASITADACVAQSPGGGDC